MAKQGIKRDETYGVTLPILRDIAKQAGRNHETALKLRETNTRETHILAAMTAEPLKTDRSLVEAWTLTFTNWEICDQTVMNLYEKLPYAYQLAIEYAQRPETFVKRTGFVIMARLGISDKKADNKKFEPFLPLIESEAQDPRHMVKKAVNWAIRQIGKRDTHMCNEMINLSKKLLTQNNPTTKWIATDALKELQSEAVQNRLRAKKS